MDSQSHRSFDVETSELYSEIAREGAADRARDRSRLGAELVLRLHRGFPKAQIALTNDRRVLIVSLEHPEHAKAFLDALVAR